MKVDLKDIEHINRAMQNIDFYSGRKQKINN